jgi:histidinol-phosphatase (PHP family)
MTNPERVSIHGCHSRDYCSHAPDTLEDLLAEYHRQDYAWVGVTEHMPADKKAFILSEEAEEGYTLETLHDRFDCYVEKIAELKSSYAGKLDIIFGFETEVYEGYERWLEELIDRYQPEYIVGSVHFVNGIGIDSSPEKLALAAEKSGGMDALYCDYFDIQLSLIERFDPRVIGHFDLIRLHDPDYLDRLQSREVWSRIERNLSAIQVRGSILDFNLAAIRKGLNEPYPCEPITQLAIEMGIPLVPGEDAHTVDTVGMDREKGVSWLQELGGNTDWLRPA